MSWPEVEIVKKENRHELVLSGRDVSDRILSKGLHPDLFHLDALNYLSISDTVLTNIPKDINHLHNLQTLALHSNKIELIPGQLTDLKKLRVLDLSRNALQCLEIDFSTLPSLTSINLSFNQLTEIKEIKNGKLALLNVSNNRLEHFPDVCHLENNSLAEIKLDNNLIEEIPNQISLLSSLKVFYVNSNKIKSVPGELSDCTKLKDVNLKSNPLQDRRLLKMVDQCHAKQVLDYVKQNCPRSTTCVGKNSKKGKKSRGEPVELDDDIEKENEPTIQRILIKRWNGDNLRIIIKDEVKDIRPHIVACILKDVQLNEDSFKRFIQLQTKLHETICEKRNLATIATHDCSKLGGDLTYTALPPRELKIHPLNGRKTMTGLELFAKLQTEAENIRKEKKRNVYTGIHKYLYLLEGKSKYPCLLTSNGDVISFPPITNADLTKMSEKTTDVLIEVTSAASQTAARKVLDTLIKETFSLFGEKLLIQQVKNVDLEGNLKSVYPARHDLIFEEKVLFVVERD